jgi:threonine dehydrogenase-like Zn-dependent dehydrogenase
VEFGATDIVTERGEEGIARVKELTNGVGADSVLECVGTPESVQQALRSTRPGGNVGKVFDLTLPLGQVAEGYKAMDERRAIKTLLKP